MIVILGKTCSGKSSVVKKLVENYGYKNIVTWTTRPKRPNEIGGVDYNFCTPEEFKKLDDLGFFAETTSYVMAGGNKASYGTAIEDIADDKVLVLNPEGYRHLNKLNSISIISFLIDTPEDILVERLRKRGDSEEEMKRRLEADDRDFSGIKDEVDYILKNEDCTLDYLAELIRMLHTGEVKVIE